MVAAETAFPDCNAVHGYLCTMSQVRSSAVRQLDLVFITQQMYARTAAQNGLEGALLTHASPVTLVTWVYTAGLRWMLRMW
jgi:hypothetical protein